LNINIRVVDAYPAHQRLRQIVGKGNVAKFQETSIFHQLVNPTVDTIGNIDRLVPGPWNVIRGTRTGPAVSSDFCKLVKLCRRQIILPPCHIEIKDLLTQHREKENGKVEVLISEVVGDASEKVRISISEDYEVLPI